MLINKHFLSRIKKESQWVIVCDIDEYIYNIQKLENKISRLKSNNILNIPTEIQKDISNMENNIIDLQNKLNNLFKV